MLDALAKLLRKKPHTAVEIAAALKCSKPTAYQWVKDLEARGEAVYFIVERRRRSGPSAKAFGIR